MAFFDMPLDQLQKYKPSIPEPSDFDSFWKATLAASAKHPLNAKFQPLNYPLKFVKAYDLTFSGYAGQRVKGWFMLPKTDKKKIPCVVEFIGYGGGRSLPTDWLLWANAGYAHLIMDTRGQGSAWSPGDTPDPEPEGSRPHHPGFMTRGVLDPKTYYYRRVFTDAVRAIAAARSHPAVDGKKIALNGGSQGGGITLAAAGLVPNTAVAMPDVPFLCHYRRATEITGA